MEVNGFHKSVNSFIPPNCAYKMGHLSKILKEYNIFYVSTAFGSIFGNKEFLDVEIEDGVIIVDRNNNLIPWDQMETCLDDLPVVSGIFACHWANVCHKCPEKNDYLTDSWVNYFQRCKKTFGVILSERMVFYATQAIYNKYSTINCTDGKYTINISRIPKVTGLETNFYISSKENLTEWTGCDVEMYEKCADFIHYKVTPKNKMLTLF